ncbi:hypothetical protein AMTR_s00059p00043440 [Amborella trichopoda]|uniref:At3g05675-like ankyrin-like domain-containing protein n=1 Tax=Amborella trichopoda TaxID=13333 RepID=U5D7T6_AMBTC|nr:hypothetical protein AMTR_s00059p00043440 [Amborella trichopoda]
MFILFPWTSREPFSFRHLKQHCLGCELENTTPIEEMQVRMKLVKDWLPVLIVCKDNATPIPSGQKSLYLELEETFLRIISTLPMSHAQELLQQCLTFSTRNVEECPHLVSAFDTWFRRAARAPPSDAGV